MDKITPRYMRFIYEFEIEVVDPVAAAAYTMDMEQDGEDGIAMAPHPDIASQMHAAVGQAITEGMRGQQDRAGFRWLGGSLLPRTPQNDECPALTLPPMPARNDDGTYTDS